MANEIEAIEWFKTNVVPKFLTTDVFKAKKILSYDVHIPQKCNNFYFCSLYAITVKIETEHSDEETLSIVIKTTTRNDTIRRLKHENEFFNNESVFYNEFTPLLECPEMFAKCYYTQAESSDTDCLVLEDLTKLNYQMTKETVFLPFDVVIRTLKELGTFHGLCYALKENHPEQFYQTVGKLQEYRYFEDSRETPIAFTYYIKACLQNGLNNLPEKNKYDPKLLEQVSQIFQDPHKFLYKLIQPVEPLAVLCHGDFNRNNIMYKYDSNDKVLGIRVIDFQTIRYALPAIDLSFFLYMNTTYEQRMEHYDQFIDTYHAALMAVLEEKAVEKSNFNKYSKQSFIDNLKTHSLYGYTIVSFFLPAMKKTNLFQESIWNMNQWSEEEVVNFAKQFGNPESDICIAQVLKEIIDRYLVQEPNLYEEYFLNNS